jgi:hypothetical protein
MAGMGMGLGSKTMVIFFDPMWCSTVPTVNMLICLLMWGFLVVVFVLEICLMPGIKYGPRNGLFSFLGYVSAVRSLTLFSVG